MRVSYNLAPKRRNREFHITIASQVPGPGNVTDEENHISILNYRKDLTLPLFDIGTFTKVSNPELIDIARKIDIIGRLKIKNNGYVYLDVTNKFIDEITPLLNTGSSFKKLNTSKKESLGAHISVFYENELINNKIWEINEINQLFQFEVKELRYIERQTKNGMQRLYLLAVDAQGLQRLRRQYGLYPKLLNHDFHITLGSELLPAIKLPAQEEAI